MKIIDAHTHLWLRQDTVVDGKEIRTTSGGRSMFMGEIRQMLPPFMTDGVNSAERLIANMDYAQVSGAVVTQEYIDGNQDEYLAEVQKRFSGRLLCCGLVDMRRPEWLSHTRRLIDSSAFRILKIPAHRLGATRLLTEDSMIMFKHMERNDVILSIDMAEGTRQVSEMAEIIAECPRLKIAIGHFGMVTVPGWTDQIRLARNENVYIESGGITWLFNDEFYPFPSAVRAIREAADLVGMEKLMWGSDYPRTIVAITYRMSYDFVLKSPELSMEEKEQFLGGNAASFYGFGPLPELPYIKNMSE